MKNVLIDPVTKKFVSLKSARGQEILAMQTAPVIDGIEAEEEEAVALAEQYIPSEEEEVEAVNEQAEVDPWGEEQDPVLKAQAEQQALQEKYEGVETFEAVPFIKERLESGLFVKTNTPRQDKNGTLALKVQMTPTSKEENFVLYRSTGHIVRNGKTFVHKGYKDCGNIPETAEAFEAYWTKREAKHLKQLQTAQEA